MMTTQEEINSVKEAHKFLVECHSEEVASFKERIAELEAKVKASGPKPIECRNCGETSMSNEFVSMGISCPKCYYEN